jgi:hypothetical protein
VYWPNIVGLERDAAAGLLCGQLLISALLVGAPSSSVKYDALAAPLKFQGLSNEQMNDMIDLDRSYLCSLFI